jgi:prepilin-type N-terminal cleavage/methylation domain-containing protein
MRVRPRPVPAGTQAGVTLVELLVTIAIMAIAFIVVLSAISVFTRSTSIHRASADLDGAMRTYSERLSAATYDATCPIDYSAVPVPTGYTAAVEAKNWTGATPAAFSACPSSDLGAQQLTVTLTHTASEQTDQLLIVKRKP